MMAATTPSIFGGVRPTRRADPPGSFDGQPAQVVDSPASRRAEDAPESPQPGADVASIAALALRDRTDSPPITAAGLLPPKVEERLLSILDAPLEAYESAHEGFARKERELGEQFAALSARVSQTLHGRLARDARGDQLATKFARLTAERRVRLLQFLSLAPRREAMARAGHRAR